MTTPTLITFRPDSLAARTINFFQHNPDEELDLEAITEKFDATRDNIHTLLSKAVALALLERSTNKDGEYIYRAGKSLAAHITHQGNAEDDAPAISDKPSKPAAKGHKAPRIALDIDALVVEEGIPYQLMANKGECKWEPLFAKLTKPGQSLQIPADTRGAISAAALKRNRVKTKGQFRVAMTSPTAARVWRIA